MGKFILADEFPNLESVSMNIATTPPAQPLKLAYISPQLPSIAVAFEQNEVLGLMACGANVTILSCRPVSTQERDDCQGFCRPLLTQVRYTSPGATVRGLLWCLMHRPGVTIKLWGRTIRAAAAHRVRVRRHLGAFLIAVAFAPLGKRAGWDGIHANWVQGTPTSAWYLSELLGLPFTMMAHAFDIYSRKPGDRELDAFFRRKAAAASAIFVAHDYGRRRLVEMYPELAPRLQVHRVAVRISEFSPLPAPPKTPYPVVVALGRLDRKKGFDQLIRAMAILRSKSDVRCEIYGAGREHGELTALIRSLNLEERVSLRGTYHQSQFADIFGPASALIAPSVESPDGDMDGIPTVIFEAMAFARPIIASALSGIPEAVVHGETGLLVEPGRPDQLADAIQDLLSDPRRAAAMGKAGRAYVEEHHDHLKQSRQLEKLLCAAFRAESVRADGVATRRR